VVSPSGFTGILILQENIQATHGATLSAQELGTMLSENNLRGPWELVLFGGSTLLPVMLSCLSTPKEEFKSKGIEKVENNIR